MSGAASADTFTNEENNAADDNSSTCTLGPSPSPSQQTGRFNYLQWDFALVHVSNSECSSASGNGGSATLRNSNTLHPSTTGRFPVALGGPYSTGSFAASAVAAHTVSGPDAEQESVISPSHGTSPMITQTVREWGRSFRLFNTGRFGLQTAAAAAAPNYHCRNSYHYNNHTSNTYGATHRHGEMLSAASLLSGAAGGGANVVRATSFQSASHRGHASSSSYDHDRAALLNSSAAYRRQSSVFSAYNNNSNSNNNNNNNSSYIFANNNTINCNNNYYYGFANAGGAAYSQSPDPRNASMIFSAGSPLPRSRNASYHHLGSSSPNTPHARSFGGHPGFLPHSVSRSPPQCPHAYSSFSLQNHSSFGRCSRGMCAQDGGVLGCTGVPVCRYMRHIPLLFDTLRCHISVSGQTIITGDRQHAFEIKRGGLIGSGGYAKVYVGVNTVSGELVAVKEMSVAEVDDVAALDAIEQEFALLKSLRHPNIVDYMLFEHSGSQKVCRIVMEFMAGDSTLKLLRKCGPLTEVVLRSLTRHLLQAIAFIHKEGIFHRDIKPANILVSHLGQVKLCDFGCSKRVSELNKPTSCIIGTPVYMAPELIKGEAHHKSDIWSMACSLFELATGLLPWYHSGVRDNLPLMFYITTTAESPLVLPSEERFMHFSAEFLDFLQVCFRRSVAHRPEARELLNHPWLTTTRPTPSPQPRSSRFPSPSVSVGSRSPPSLAASLAPSRRPSPWRAPRDAGTKDGNRRSHHDKDAGSNDVGDGMDGGRSHHNTDDNHTAHTNTSAKSHNNHNMNMRDSAWGNQVHKTSHTNGCTRGGHVCDPTEGSHPIHATRSSRTTKNRASLSSDTTIISPFHLHRCPPRGGGSSESSSSHHGAQSRSLSRRRCSSSNDSGGPASVRHGVRCRGGGGHGSGSSSSSSSSNRTSSHTSNRSRAGDGNAPRRHPTRPRPRSPRRWYRHKSTTSTQAKDRCASPRTFSMLTVSANPVLDDETLCRLELEEVSAVLAMDLCRSLMHSPTSPATHYLLSPPPPPCWSAVGGAVTPVPTFASTSGGGDTSTTVALSHTRLTEGSTSMTLNQNMVGGGGGGTRTNTPTNTTDSNNNNNNNNNNINNNNNNINTTMASHTNTLTATARSSSVPMPVSSANASLAARGGGSGRGGGLCWDGMASMHEETMFHLSRARPPTSQAPHPPYLCMSSRPGEMTPSLVSPEHSLLYENNPSTSAAGNANHNTMMLDTTNKSTNHTNMHTYGNMDPSVSHAMILREDVFSPIDLQPTAQLLRVNEDGVVDFATLYEDDVGDAFLQHGPLRSFSMDNSMHSMSYASKPRSPAKAPTHSASRDGAGGTTAVSMPLFDRLTPLHPSSRSPLQHPHPQPQHLLLSAIHDKELASPHCLMTHPHSTHPAMAATTSTSSSTNTHHNHSSGAVSPSIRLSLRSHTRASLLPSRLGNRASPSLSPRSDVATNTAPGEPNGPCSTSASLAQRDRCMATSGRLSSGTAIHSRSRSQRQPPQPATEFGLLSPAQTPAPAATPFRTVGEEASTHADSAAAAQHPHDGKLHMSFIIRTAPGEEMDVKLDVNMTDVQCRLVDDEPNYFVALSEDVRGQIAARIKEVSAHSAASPRTPTQSVARHRSSTVWKDRCNNSNNMDSSHNNTEEDHASGRDSYGEDNNHRHDALARRSRSFSRQRGARQIVHKESRGNTEGAANGVRDAFFCGARQDLSPTLSCQDQSLIPAQSDAVAGVTAHEGAQRLRHEEQALAAPSGTPQRSVCVPARSNAVPSIPSSPHVCSAAVSSSVSLTRGDANSPSTLST